MRAWPPLVLALALGCAAPATCPGLDWGGYEDSLRRLVANPGGLEAYGASLRRILDRNPDGTRVPPGLYAEYGYVLFLSGRKEEAAGFFTKEKTRWPEASLLMDRMIRACAPPPKEPS
ncbi:DUF4810 domain-containing protein [Mesoterricola silvestris]|uniref:DUF4810 domain-containing protein n=1 Tax=Mesoterricola silvestris TaxID=2927979 RepID=A0AA48GPX3_9BACT|nr:DUF4810 domain-containing protein [Mesoterricola silvestris]BDU72015.1 hypothetical protein METEAL_11890 [Mesoterricola silvestris]